MNTSDKKRILVNYTGRNGGGPIDAIEMTKGFIKNGHRVSAIISEQVSNRKAWRELPLDKLLEVRTYDGYLSYLQRTAQLQLGEKRRIKNQLGNKYDLIYCPMITPWTGMINSLFPDITTCVVNHDPIPHSKDVRHFLLKLNGIGDVYKKADYIVVHSKGFLEYIEQSYGKLGKTLYVPLGPHNLKAAKKQDYYSENTTNFLFFGRIEHYKGVDILLKAYKTLRDEKEDVALYIVGNGDITSYQHLIEHTQDVHVFNRWIEDDEVGDFFNGEGVVLVLPYRDATQSGPAVIALEYGIPTIASNAGGLKEQVIHGKTGLLVEPENEEELYLAMRKLAGDSGFYSKLCEGAKIELGKIGWEQSAKKIIEFMDHIGGKDETF